MIPSDWRDTVALTIGTIAAIGCLGCILFLVGYFVFAVIMG